MQLESIKAVIATVWVFAVGITAMAGSFQSLRAWTVLVGVAVVPPLVMTWRWNHPAQTMSESIQEARR